jgi:hypothetical protein
MKKYIKRIANFQCLEAARKLFSRGMTVEDIADVTDLSPKEIESLDLF